MMQAEAVAADLLALRSQPAEVEELVVLVVPLEAQQAEQQVQPPGEQEAVVEGLLEEVVQLVVMVVPWAVGQVGVKGLQPKVQAVVLEQQLEGVVVVAVVLDRQEELFLSMVASLGPSASWQELFRELASQLVRLFSSL